MLQVEGIGVGRSKGISVQGMDGGGWVDAGGEGGPSSRLPCSQIRSARRNFRTLELRSGRTRSRPETLDRGIVRRLIQVATVRLLLLVRVVTGRNTCVAGTGTSRIWCPCTHAVLGRHPPLLSTHTTCAVRTAGLSVTRSTVRLHPLAHGAVSAVSWQVDVDRNSSNCMIAGAIIMSGSGRMRNTIADSS